MVSLIQYLWKGKNEAGKHAKNLVEQNHVIQLLITTPKFPGQLAILTSLSTTN